MVSVAGVEAVERLSRDGGSSGGVVDESIEVMGAKPILQRLEVAFLLAPLGSAILEPDLKEIVI